jgi:type IX secretion system PorP/SprF family membrane protein
MSGQTRYLFSRTILLAGLVLACLAPEGFGQQAPQFTQYMFNGLLINPAYAGAEEALSITFIDRHQWLGVENAPTTQALTAHAFFEKRKSGLGLSIINDKIGIHKNLSAQINYAYHLKTGFRSSLSAGFQAGMHSLRSNYPSLMGNGNNDPALQNSIAETFFHFGVGFYFRSPKFHLGVSAPELIPGKISLNDTLTTSFRKTSILVFSKYRLTFSEMLQCEPSLFLKHTPGLPLSVDSNVNMIFRKVLTVGVSYRWAESVDFLLKTQLTPQLQFGYAYDYPTGPGANLSTGSHEFMVNYIFQYDQLHVSPR